MGYELASRRAEIFLNLESVCTASQVLGGEQCCAAAGTRVDDHVVLVGKQPYQRLQQRHALLRGVDFRRHGITRIVHAVENHLPLVVELRQLVAVEQYAVFAVAHDFHVRLEHLRRIVFAEHEVDVMVEAVALAKLNEIHLLVERAENNHARCFPRLFRFFDEHLRAEVHELCRLEVLVCVKELLACQLALAVAVVAVFIPHGIGGVGVVAEVIGHVGYDELRLWYALALEVLKVVVK